MRAKFYELNKSDWKNVCRKGGVGSAPASPMDIFWFLWIRGPECEAETHPGWDVSPLRATKHVQICTHIYT